MSKNPAHANELPPLPTLLVSGGDERILPQSNGLNKYGLPATPEPQVPAFGSCTVSSISFESFAAAGRLRDRLQQAATFEASALTYARELNGLRAELQQLTGVTNAAIVFADSGTTVHLLAAQLFKHANTSPLSVIMIETAETGRGVPAALSGRHFSERAPLGSYVPAGAAISSDSEIEVAEIPVRTDDGHLRPAAMIDAEIETRIKDNIAAGRRVLLNMVDGSKTGLLTPSPACAIALKKRFGARLEIFVDACQFRLTAATLRFYLEQEFCVALTGSKFMSGPSFSGALFIPHATAKTLRTLPLSPGLERYSAHGDWPPDWTAAATLPAVANYGLLLRWEAALVEMREFYALPPAAVAEFFQSFADAVQKHLGADPIFEKLPVAPLNRYPILADGTWDTVQTIFPFLLRHPAKTSFSTYLSKEETKRIYELIGDNPIKNYRIGQPVDCGQRQGNPISALRLCASARLAVDALSAHGSGPKPIIAEALSALDHIAALVRKAESFIN